MARVVIGHGYTNLRPPEHWQHRAAVALRNAGHQVQYPQFPAPEAPVAADWQTLLIAETAMACELSPDHGELIYIGHSLGCINWLLAAGAGRLPAVFDRVLLVAPADPVMLGRIPGYDIALGNPSFLTNVRAAAKSIVLLGSDSDPWSPSGIQSTFGDPLGLEARIIVGAKHFSKDDGFGPWQGVIDWVENPDADLMVR